MHRQGTNSSYSLERCIDLRSTELTFCAVLPLPAVLNHKDEKNLCDDPAFAAPVGAILGLRGDMG